MPGREFIHGRHSRPGPGGASVRRRAVRAGTRRAANEFVACYAKPAEGGLRAATGFSRFRKCQAVNSFMAGILRAATGFSRFPICPAVNAFMAGIHGRAPAVRAYAGVPFARTRGRQRMNSPPVMPSPLKRAARRNRLQPVSEVPGREFIHGRHSRPGPGGASARMRAIRAPARMAANEFVACYAKPAEAGCAPQPASAGFQYARP